MTRNPFTIYICPQCRKLRLTKVIDVDTDKRYFCTSCHTNQVHETPPPVAFDGTNWGSNYEWRNQR